MIAEKGPLSSYYQESITPDNYPDLQLWLKPDSLSSYANGQAITEWRDSSGNNWSAQQGSSAIAPLMSSQSINTYATAQFTGTKSMVVPGFFPALGNSERTFILVIQNVAFTGSGWNEVLLNYGDRDSGIYSICTSVAGTYNFGVSNEATYNNSGYSFNSAPHIIASRFNGSVNELYVDGVKVSSKAMTLNTIATSPLMFGRDVIYYVYYAMFDLAEVIIYDRALSEVEFHNVQYYLSNKYNIPIH